MEVELEFLRFQVVCKHINRSAKSDHPLEHLYPASVIVPFCTEFLDMALSAQKIVLQGDNGKYLSRIHRNGIDPIEVAKDSPDSSCEFQVVKNGDSTYSFIADNYKYLSRIYRKNINAVEAAKDYIDLPSRFDVIDHNNGQISLRAADNKLYLSRVNRGSTDPVEAAKIEADAFSCFTVTQIQVAGAKYQKQ